MRKDYTFKEISKLNRNRRGRSNSRTEPTHREHRKMGLNEIKRSQKMEAK